MCNVKSPCRYRTGQDLQLLLGAWALGLAVARSMPQIGQNSEGSLLILVRTDTITWQRMRIANTLAQCSSEAAWKCTRRPGLKVVGR